MNFFLLVCPTNSNWPRNPMRRHTSYIVPSAPLGLRHFHFSSSVPITDKLVEKLCGFPGAAIGDFFAGGETDASEYTPAPLPPALPWICFKMHEPVLRILRIASL